MSLLKLLLRRLVRKDKVITSVNAFKTAPLCEARHGKAALITNKETGDVTQQETIGEG